MIEAARFSQIQTLFSQAAELPADKRHGFLQMACGGDETLLADVLLMLKEDEASSSLLDDDVASLAHGLFKDVRADVNKLRDFGPYRLKRMLGEGGMGIVFLADRADLGSVVAIKILRDVLSPIRLQRFRTEQRILAQLTHPFIGRLYDADVLPDGTPYFAMEYVDGVPLTEYCRQNTCNLQAILRLFRDLCSAVQYAHAHALIHRDLKPSNVLVRPDGSMSLIDFGIAKELENNDPDNETITGLRLMTPAYAAPEQLRGTHAGIRTDVYSLGVILYELLTGLLPYDVSQRSPGEIEAMVLHQEPPKPSVMVKKQNRPNSAELKSADWEDLDVLCLVAMHKEPERRYQSVEAMIRDVDNYLAGRPLEARPDSVGYRTRKFLHRNLKSVVAAAAIVIAVLAMGVFFVIRLNAAKNEALTQAARSERIKNFMTGLFQGGGDVGPSLDLRAVDILDRGISEAGQFKSDPKTQADLYQTLSDSYQELGKYDKAASLAESALRIRQAQFGKDSLPVAESLVELGSIRAEQSKTTESLQLIGAGMAIDEKQLARDDFEIGVDRYRLGRALVRTGDLQAAIAALEEAARILSRPGAPQLMLAQTFGTLGVAYFDLGNFALAESFYEKSLTILRRIYSPSNPLISEELINIGSVRFQEQRFDDAGRYYSDGLQTIEKWYGRDNTYYANALAFLGQVRAKQKRYKEAQAALRQALALHEKYIGKVSYFVGVDLNALGIVDEKLNQWRQAETDFLRAVAIGDALSTHNRHQFSITLHSLSEVSVHEHRLALAEKQSRTALAEADASLPPTHLYAGVIRMGLGKVLMAEKRFREAEPYLIESCSILEKQGNPNSAVLQDARSTLANDRRALGKIGH